MKTTFIFLLFIFGAPLFSVAPPNPYNNRISETGEESLLISKERYLSEKRKATQLQKKLESRLKTFQQLKSKSPLFAPSDRDLLGSSSEKAVPSVEPINVAVIPVEYSDARWTNSLPTHIDNFNNFSNYLHYMFNGNDPGCFKHYFLENSYGKLNINAIIFKKMTLNNYTAHYGSVADPDFERFALEAGGKLVTNFNSTSASTLSNLDNNKDGYIDAIIFIHKGQDAETSRNNSDIHSHAFSYSTINRTFTTTSGFKLGRYTIVAETLNPNSSNRTNRTTIGTIAHEFGHILGLPDLYVNSSVDNTMNITALMDLGSYNFSSYYKFSEDGKEWLSPVYGASPSPVTPYHKALLGWIEPFDANEGTVTLNLSPNSNTPPEIANLKGVREDEYFIAEYKRPLSYDFGIFYTSAFNGKNRDSLYAKLSNSLGGISLTKIDRSIYNQRYDFNFVNYFDYEKAILYVPADGGYAEDGNEFTTNSLWTERNSFTPFSFPSSAYSDDTPSQINLTSIVLAPSSATFQFALREEELPKDQVIAKGWPSPYRGESAGVTLVIHLPKNDDNKYDELKELTLINAEGVKIFDFPMGNFLSRESLNQTSYSTIWDGKDDENTPISPGVYYLRFRSEHSSGTINSLVIGKY